jgi:hypothetical protein
MSRSYGKSTETDSVLVSPLQALPCQFTQARGSMSVPEVRLVAAVLEHALRSIASFRRGGHREVQEAAAAREWLLDGDRSPPFAFENVCEWLGLDADDVRGRFAVDGRWSATASRSAPRARFAPKREERARKR